MTGLLRIVLYAVGVFWIVVGLLGPGGWIAVVAGALLLWAGMAL